MVALHKRNGHVGAVWEIAYKVIYTIHGCRCGMGLVRFERSL
ncbi:hypothetical protein [Bartonella massiliensis]|nr:hypothetical protein [Bartonella massiliensis]